MNRELLERPFPPEQIKQREGAFGDVRRSGRPTRYQVGPTTVTVAAKNWAILSE